MNINAEGIVLRSVDYKESDKILTVLTRDRGNLTVKASGAPPPGRRFAPGAHHLSNYENSQY